MNSESVRLANDLIDAVREWRDLKLEQWTPEWADGVVTLKARIIDSAEKLSTAIKDEGRVLEYFLNQRKAEESDEPEEVAKHRAAYLESRFRQIRAMSDEGFEAELANLLKVTS